MEIREGHNKFYINDEQGKQIAEIVFVPTGENLAIIEKRALCPFFVHPPTLQMLSCITPQRA